MSEPAAPGNPGGKQGTPGGKRGGSGGNGNRSEGASLPNRDGVSGLLDADRALRAREVSRPTAADRDAAAAELAQRLAKVRGRRT